MIGIYFSYPLTFTLVKHFSKVNTMSNQTTAYATAGTMSAADRKPARGFWGKLFDAWIRAHASRMDPNGNVMLEL